MAVSIDNWRDADGVWVAAPADSHVKQFRAVFFKAGRHSIEVTFKSKRGAKGQIYPESSYRYWQKSDDTGLASVINIFNALVAAPSPGEIIDAWLKKGGWPYAKI